MTARSEPYYLIRIRYIGPALEIITFEARHVDQHLFWRRLAGKWRNSFYNTLHGCSPQMFVAYSAIVRSLENFPEPATFKMAFRAQLWGSE